MDLAIHSHSPCGVDSGKTNSASYDPFRPRKPAAELKNSSSNVGPLSEVKTKIVLSSRPASRTA